MIRLFKRFVAHNAKLKIVAIVLAVVAWVYVRGWTVEDRTFQAQLRIPEPDGFIISAAAPVAAEFVGSEAIGRELIVDVTLSIGGPSTAMRNLRSDDLVVKYDLAEHGVDLAIEDGRPRTYRVQITADLFDMASELVVHEMDPTAVTLEIDRRVTKELQVQANVIGQVAEGFEMQPAWVAPKSAEVSGPSKILAEATVALTTPVDVNKLDRSISTIRHITEMGGEPVRCDVDVLVMIEITKVPEPPVQKLLEGVGIRIEAPLGFDARVEITDADGLPVTAVNVTIEGPADAVAAVEPRDVKAYVDVSIFHGTGTKEGKVPLTIRPLVGVRVAQQPPTVTVKLIQRKL